MAHISLRLRAFVRYSPQERIASSSSARGAFAIDCMSGYFSKSDTDTSLTRLSVHCADNLAMTSSFHASPRQVSPHSACGYCRLSASRMRTSSSPSGGQDVFFAPALFRAAPEPVDFFSFIFSLCHERLPFLRRAVCPGGTVRQDTAARNPHISDPDRPVFVRFAAVRFSGCIISRFSAMLQTDGRSATRCAPKIVGAFPCRSAFTHASAGRMFQTK